MKYWFKSLFGKNKKEQPDVSLLEIEPDESDGIEGGDVGTVSKKRERRSWSKKKKALFASLLVVGLALITIFAYAMSIWFNPLGEWRTTADQISPPVTAPPDKTPNITGDDIQTPEPTVDPYEELLSKADMDFLKDIINVMLIGVDYAEERETWKGKKAFHADVMMIMAINTKTNEVNLISLPRDTYANIPGVKGIYKLNASIDCGGGWPTDSGFNKVCKAASWMLGGKIPVEYYYAVDMAAVKQLVDSIGGIDFEIEFNYKMQGRSYTKGMQHLDGQAVLDYLRVRHLDSDLKRTGRQKKLLVEIFKKVKENGDLFHIPDMLAAFEGNFYTNTTLGQTAGLAAFFYQYVDSESIQLHLMEGNPNKNVNIFNWNFLITNQKKRVALIKKIYGITVKQYEDFTIERASFLWESMQAGVITEKTEPILKKVKAALDEDALRPEKPAPAPPPPVDPEEPDTEPTPEPTPEPTAPPGGWRKYGADIWDLYNLAVSQYEQLLSWSAKYVSEENTAEYKATNTELKKNVESLCALFSIKKPDWKVNYEKETNEILVDFR